MEDTQTQKRHMTKQLIERETAERVSRIDREFAEGFDAVNALEKTVTIFGSARFSEDNKYYQLARELGGRLAQEDYTVITGGGGGIMEAGNRGAFEAGGKSIGFNISLPHEQVLNPYTTSSMPFKYFFARKVILTYGAMGYVYFPGGFGTLDELFEIMTLIQTDKAPDAPIILMGSEYWSGLSQFVREKLVDGVQTIGPNDESLYMITDSVDEAVEYIKSFQPPAAE
ncbi:MAG: TIGR00730 family Rossman fold protein [Candidatus Saccharimonas sp.]